MRLLAQRADMTLQAAATSEELLAFGRQDKTASNAVEKLEAELLLEIADLPRQSGLGNVKVERCLGYRALLGHGDKRSKAPEVHAMLIPWRHRKVDRLCIGRLRSPGAFSSGRMPQPFRVNADRGRHGPSAPSISASGSGGRRAPGVSRVRLGTELPDHGTVRIIVGFAAGTGADILARLMGQWLSERFGQQFVIENRPGAGTNIATEAVVRAAPDGYTLLAVSPANAINATLYEKLNFNFIRDIAPVASIMRTPNVMVVNPSVPAKSVPEFIAYAKANPGKISFASAGNGSGSHMSGELFKMMTGVDMVHVPYRGGGPALTDLLGGQVQLMFPGTTASIAYIRAGKLRALGSHHCDALGGAAGHPDRRRFRAGLRSKSGGWRWRSQEHAAGDRRSA